MVVWYQIGTVLFFLVGLTLLIKWSFKIDKKDE